MSQSMPEILDYRNLMGKLARIDSEWESLKGLLSFRSPHQPGEFADLPAPLETAPVGRESRVGGLADRLGGLTPAPGVQGGSNAPPITADELAAITQTGAKNIYDKILMARIVKVEKRLRRIVAAGIALMSVTLVLLAVLTFFLYQDQSASKLVISQATRITTPAASTPGEPRVAESAPQSCSVAALPAGNVRAVSETEMSPPPPPTDQANFVASLTSNKIHTPDCRWAARINPRKLISFPTMAAAAEQGYQPCPVCRPQDAD